MDSEVICNPKNYESLTHSVNNIGIRDASASKNILCVAQLPVKVKPIFANKRTQEAPIFGSTPESWAMKRAATALKKDQT